ncbi:MAG: prephenate dehydrogenase, partial [Gaiellaceae bacterium]
MVSRVAILGTGLIGASIGLAARAAGASVRGFDTDAGALAVAAERGAVEPAATLGEAVRDAELAVAAGPVASLPAQVREILAVSDATVTDVGSTKGAVCSAVDDGRFIGGHPIAGAESHGPEHARADLFAGATWLLAPSAMSEPERYRLVHGFVVALGATPVAVDPAAHDRLLA